MLSRATTSGHDGTTLSPGWAEYSFDGETGPTHDYSIRNWTPSMGITGPGASQARPAGTQRPRAIQRGEIPRMGDLNDSTEDRREVSIYPQTAMSHPVVARALEKAYLEGRTDAKTECKRILDALEQATYEAVTEHEQRTGSSGLVPTFSGRQSGKSSVEEVWDIVPVAKEGEKITRSSLHPALQEMGAIPEFKLWSLWR